MKTNENCSLKFCNYLWENIHASTAFHFESVYNYCEFMIHEGGGDTTLTLNSPPSQMRKCPLKVSTT